MSQGRLIKRYANRKLYDTANSRYVTLEEVAALLQAGEDVRIIDNQSKADITAVTLAQILVEEEKRGRQPRAQGGLRQLLQRRIAEPVLQIRSTVEESVSRLLKSDPASPKAEVRTETRSEPPKPEQKPEVGKPEEGRHTLLDELQRRFDEGLKHLVPGHDGAARTGAKSERPAPAAEKRDSTPAAPADPLQAQVAQLSARLDRIEALLGLTRTLHDAPER